MFMLQVFFGTVAVRMCWFVQEARSNIGNGTVCQVKRKYFCKWENGLFVKGKKEFFVVYVAGIFWQMYVCVDQTGRCVVFDVERMYQQLDVAQKNVFYCLYGKYVLSMEIMVLQGGGCSMGFF